MRVLRLFRIIPFIGGIPETSPRDHLEAGRELILAQIIATMPIWIGAVSIAWPEVSPQHFFAGILGMIKNGELFIYAATTLAPVIYIVSRDRDVPRSFPNKYWYLSIVWIGTIIAAVVYTMQRKNLQPISESTLTLSIWIYLGALFLLYFAFVFNNSYLPDAASAMRQEEDDYTQRVRNHR